MNPDNNTPNQYNPDEPINQPPPQTFSPIQPQAQSPIPPPLPTPLAEHSPAAHQQPADGIVVSGDFTPDTTATSATSSNIPGPGQTFDAAAGAGVLGSNAPTPGTLNTAAPVAKKSRLSFFKKKAFVLPLAVLLILGIGSAAAFYVVIKPNMPASKLQAAFVNTLQQKQFSYNATVTSDPTSSGGVAVKAIANGSLNTSSQDLDSTISTTISGVTINAEVRYVGQNLYIKFGDLSSLITILNGLDPAFSSAAGSISSQLSNQWVEVDSTLLKEAGLSCIIDNNNTLTNSDINQLKADYSKNPFIVIKSHTSATIGGAASEEYVLNVNDDKANNFGNSLTNLPLAKSLEKCQDFQSSTKDASSKGDNKITPLSVWVDKSTKRIDQIEYQSTMDGKTGKLVLSLGYNASSVSAPANSKPLLTVLANLESSLNSSGNGSTLDSLFGGSSSTDSPSSISSNSILQ
jgi:hypothetical protein